MDLNFSNIPQAIEDEIKSDNDMKKLSLDFTEIAIDEIVFNDELLKKIPFSKTFYEFYNGVISVSNRLLIAKILKFISTAKNDPIPDDKRIKFLSSISDKKLGLELLLILDKTDDMVKVELIGKIFRFFMLGLMTYDEFTRCSHGINNSFIQDINLLLTKSNDTEYKQNLIDSGFTKIVIGREWNDVGEVYFEITDLGKKLIDLMNKN